MTVKRGYSQEGDEILDYLVRLNSHYPRIFVYKLLGKGRI